MIATPADLDTRPLDNAKPLSFHPDFEYQIGTVTRPDWLELDIDGDTYQVYKGDAYAASVKRAQLYRDAEDNPAIKTQLRHACSQRTAASCILWINTFCVTYKQYAIDEKGHKLLVTDGVSVPFTTWPVQDWCVKEILNAIWNGHDLVVDKSRQMGVTWLISAVFMWAACNLEDQNFVVMSMIEELVDNPGDPFAIMWKMDHLIRQLPAWIRPEITRSHLKISMPKLGSSIFGRSTTGGKGRGGSPTAVLFDEAAQNITLRENWLAFGESTQCRIANSTPWGPGAYSELVRSPQIKTLIMPWWEHPEKGVGRELAYDDEEQSWYVTSPYYELACDRAGGRHTTAIKQELDMDHMASESLVIEQRTLARKKLTDARTPDWHAELRTPDKMSVDVICRQCRVADIQFVSTEEDGIPKGRWRLWTDLEEIAGVWRPPQKFTYVIGADISHGMGASNSALFVWNANLGEQVGEFVDPFVSPDQLAREAAKAGIWFGGGSGMAFQIWEANGAGGRYGDELVNTLRYGWFYHMKDERKTAKKRTRMHGWYSNRERKLNLFELIRTGLNRDSAIIHSEHALDDLGSYIIWKNGDIGPGELEDADGKARTPHGDLAIACAVGWYGVTQVPRYKPKAVVPPYGSVGWRRWKAGQDAKARRMLVT